MNATALASSQVAFEPTIQDFFDAAEQEAEFSFLQLAHDRVVRIEAREPGCCSSLSEEERAANARTWQAFERAVKTAYSPIQIKRFCTRYDLNFQREQDKGSFLELSHVAKVGVGASRVFTNDILGVAQMPREQIAARLQAAPYLGPKKPATRIMGGPDTMRDMFVYDPFLLDQKRQQLSPDILDLYNPGRFPRVPDYAFCDRLTKVFSSLELTEGEIIPALTRDGKLDFFEVYRKIGTGDGLVAFALKPLSKNSTLVPSLVFRPTQVAFVAEDFFMSIANGTERCMGLTGYAAAKADFATLLQDGNFRTLDGQKIRVIAYSEGSTQAQRFMMDFWADVEEALLLCGPSPDRETVTAFSNMINTRTDPSLGPKCRVEVYRNRATTVSGGDRSDYLGETHFGLGIHPDNPYIEVHLTEFQNSLDIGKVGEVLGPHAFRPGEPEYTINPPVPAVITYEYPRAELDTQFDNTLRGPEIAQHEAIRTSWGMQILYAIGFGFYYLVYGLLSCLGIQLFRSSRTLTPESLPQPD